MDPAARFAALLAQEQNGGDGASLDLMAALIGASFDSDADADAVVAALDDVAAECDPTFESILTTLFGTGRLRGNTDDYSDPRNSYLHEVLHRGLGIPITLSICAIEVGRRAGVAVVGLGLPGHFLVACDGEIADPFNGGVRYASDQLESTWQRITGATQTLDPRLLQPIDTRSILLRMLNNLKATFVAMDDPAPLRVLATLRGAFPELAGERAEYSRWLRHWN